jgi:hypothetical protein
MTDNHPIIPPPELVEEWASMLEYSTDKIVFSLAAQWGADQELEACCMWITREKSVLIAEELGIVRRPKPPSLKEQALDDLTSAERLYPADWSSIRKALETLPND